MARHLPFLARVVCVSAIIVIVAIVSRQVYLRSAEADVVDAHEAPARMMLIRCETMHDRLQNRHSSAAEADERPRARCLES